MPVGVRSWLGLGKEETWSGNATLGDYLIYTRENLIHAIEQLMEAELWGSPDEPPQFEGGHTVQGDVEFLVRPIGIGFFLASVLGLPVTTGEAAPYTHTFLPVAHASEFSTDCPLIPYTLWISRDAGTARYVFKGSVVNELTLEVGPAGKKIMTATANIIARYGHGTASSSPTPTFEAYDPFIFHQAAVNLPSGHSHAIENFRCRFINHLEPVFLMDSDKFISKIFWQGHREYQMELAFGYPVDAERTNFLNQTEGDFDITLASGTNSIKIETKNLRYETYDMGMKDPGRLKVGVTAKAKYDAALTAPVKVTLVNDKSGY